MTSPAYAHAYWPAAGTTSNAVGVSGGQVVGFLTPGTLTSTALTFATSDAVDGTYVPVKTSGGSAVSFTVAAAGYYGFTADQIAAFRGVQFLKVVGGSSEAAGRQVKLAVREVA